MGGFSLIHWLILGVVVLLLFGSNRFSNMMGDVAKGLKAFKQGMAEDENAPPPQRPAEPRQLPRDRPIDLTPTASSSEQPAAQAPDESRR